MLRLGIDGRRNGRLSMVQHDHNGLNGRIRTLSRGPGRGATNTTP
jgi:hypothetical protein